MSPQSPYILSRHNDLVIWNFPAVIFVLIASSSTPGTRRLTSFSLTVNITCQLASFQTQEHTKLSPPSANLLHRQITTSFLFYFLPISCLHLFLLLSSITQFFFLIKFNDHCAFYPYVSKIFLKFGHTIPSSTHRIKLELFKVWLGDQQDQASLRSITSPEHRCLPLTYLIRICILTGNS